MSIVAESDSLRRLFGSAGIYTVANILNGAVPFLLLPVLTRFLSPEDYGIVAMFAVLLTLSSVVGGMGLHGAVNRRYFQSDRTRHSEYAGTALLLFTGAILLLGSVLFILADLIERVTAFPAAWIWALLLAVPGHVLGQLTLILLQVRFRSRGYAVFQIGQTLLNAGLSVLFVVGLGMEWQGRILGQALPLAVGGIVGLALILRVGWVRVQWNPEYARDALIFGLPLIPHLLGGVAIKMTDRVVLTNVVGVDATGIYLVGVQMGMGLLLLAEAFNRAYSPWLLERLEGGDAADKVRIVRVTYGYAVVIVALALSLGLLAPWILDWLVGEDFRAAGPLVMWLALGYAFKGMYFMVTHYIFFSDRTGWLAAVTTVSVGVNLGLNLALIPPFGMLGAAWASAATFLVSFLLTAMVASRLCPMPWRSALRSK